MRKEDLWTFKIVHVTYEGCFFLLLLLRKTAWHQSLECRTPKKNYLVFRMRWTMMKLIFHFFLVTFCYVVTHQCYRFMFSIAISWNSFRLSFHSTCWTLSFLFGLVFIVHGFKISNEFCCYFFFFDSILFSLFDN